MSADKELTCKELIDIANELTHKLSVTGELPKDYSFGVYEQDIAHIRHALTNYEDILYEFETYKIPAMMFDKKPEELPQGIIHICKNRPQEGRCINEEYAYFIIKSAANNLAKQLYRKA